VIIQTKQKINCTMALVSDTDLLASLFRRACEAGRVTEITRTAVRYQLETRWALWKCCAPDADEVFAGWLDYATARFTLIHDPPKEDFFLDGWGRRGRLAPPSEAPPPFRVGATWCDYVPDEDADDGREHQMWKPALPITIGDLVSMPTLWERAPQPIPLPLSNEETCH
jgi:hypothetical protein